MIAPEIDKLQYMNFGSCLYSKLVVNYPQLSAMVFQVYNLEQLKNQIIVNSLKNSNLLFNSHLINSNQYCNITKQPFNSYIYNSISNETINNNFNVSDFSKKFSNNNTTWY